MRKILVFFVLFSLLCSLVFSAGAAPAAKSINAYASVSTDGTCQVTLTVTIHLDQPTDDLRFPLPEEAGSITVNGSRVFSRTENGLRYVDLSGTVGKVAGDFTLTFIYSLPNLIVTNDAGLLELRLPILSGFAYPVQNLEFSVTLPGAVESKPAFSSGYHQANIEKDITYTVSGPTVSGVSQVELKDHETLMMTLFVSETMFPQTRITPPDFQTVSTLMTVFLVLALVYWVFFLRNLPAWPAPQTTAPEGYIAGMFGSVLHLQGADLHMMVFSWAQLGYLLIQLDRGGRVYLHKQMDMGNERSAFEQRCFRELFGRHQRVDTGSLRYVETVRNVAKMQPNLAAFIHRKTGNLRVFRALAAIGGLFGGVWLGLGLSTGAGLQWFWGIVLGSLALLSSWYIQRWAAFVMVPEKRRLWYTLALCGVWLLLGILSRQTSAALTLVIGQLVAGLLTALGGRRTREGRQAMGDILGLRRYLASVPRSKLDAICNKNPEYFHQMAPYALALGVDARFARQFGGRLIDPCPYIAAGTNSAMHAAQWCRLMRRVLRSMEARYQRSTIEKITYFFHAFFRT